MSGVIEYRDDDTSIGYCPACSRRLTNVTTEGKGFCSEHGLMFANWEPGLRRFELSAYVTVIAKDGNEALELARELDVTSEMATISIDDGEPIDVTEDWDE